MGGQAAMATARCEFERWRLRRRRGARIPDSLWQMAVDLARAHGVSKASLALHLDYYGLQRRLTGSRPATCDPSQPAFVELSLRAGHGQAHCQLELIDPAGGRVRVDVSGLSARELATFVRVLAGQERSEPCSR